MEEGTPLPRVHRNNGNSTESDMDGGRASLSAVVGPDLPRSKKRKSEGNGREVAQRSADRKARHFFQPNDETCHTDHSGMVGGLSDQIPNFPVGATVRVTGGRHVGIIGVVKDAQNPMLTVELPQPSRLKTVRTKSNQLERTTCRPARATRYGHEVSKGAPHETEDKHSWAEKDVPTLAVMPPSSPARRFPFLDDRDSPFPTNVQPTMQQTSGGRSSRGRSTTDEAPNFKPSHQVVNSFNHPATDQRDRGLQVGLPSRQGVVGTRPREGHRQGAEMVKDLSNPNEGGNAAPESRDASSAVPRRRLVSGESDSRDLRMGKTAENCESNHDSSNENAGISPSSKTEVLRSYSGISSSGSSSGEGFVDVAESIIIRNSPSTDPAPTATVDADRRMIPAALGFVSDRNRSDQDKGSPDTTFTASTATTVGRALSSKGSSSAGDNGVVGFSSSNDPDRCTAASEDEIRHDNDVVEGHPPREYTEQREDDEQVVSSFPAQAAPSPTRRVLPAAPTDVQSPKKALESETGIREKVSKSPASSPQKSGLSWRRPRPPGLTLAADEVDTEACASGLTKATQVLENLWLSGQEVTGDRLSLQREGVTHIVNCSVKLVNFYPRAFSYHRVGWEDEEGQDVDPPVLEAAFRHIDAARRSGSACLVHCKAGTSRSCSLVLGYLMQHEDGMSLLAALEFCQAKRRQCNPDKSFLEKLSEYEECLFGQTTVSLDEYHRGDVARSLVIGRTGEAEV